MTHAPGAPVVAYRAFEVECIVVNLMNLWRERLRLHYIVRAQHETIRRVLRWGWRAQDHLQLLEEARRHVAVALVQGDRHVGHRGSSLASEIVPRSAFYAVGVGEPVSYERVGGLTTRERPSSRSLLRLNVEPASGSPLSAPAQALRPSR